MPPLWHTFAKPNRYQRSRRPLFFIIVSTVLIALIIYTTSSDTAPLTRIQSGLNRISPFTSSSVKHGSCTPTEYASGRWALNPWYTRPGPLSRTDTSDPLAARLRLLELARKHRPEKMEKKEDALRFARFQGCASTDNFWWQFATVQPEQWEKRFPHTLDWEWVPGGRCAKGEREGGLREWETESVVKELAERGGWLFIGDSVTGNHYFSLSCLLYPHVVENKPTSNERDRPQHLYLNPSSPLVSSLRLPAGFNITSTPLVTFRRVDLLWSPEELTKMHRELHPEFYKNPHPEQGEFQLFGKEAVWSMPLENYLRIFFSELPEANYRTMVVSTAGHWTTNLFDGYHRRGGSDAYTPIDNGTSMPTAVEAGRLEDREPVIGYEGLLVFFNEVMERWMKAVQGSINAEMAEESRVKEENRKNSSETLAMRERQVLIRAYLPGHDDCHHQTEPWEKIKPWKMWYNWGEIKIFNQVWPNILSKAPSTYKNIHYLGIDRPARLRPDGHSATDCLHIMTGAGILEGWSHYIWHYITREIS